MSGTFLRVVDWIGRGEGLHGPWMRLGVAIAAQFLWFLWRDWRDGDLTSLWWTRPLLYAFFLFAPFCLWRFMERRRSAQRRREKAVVRLNLS